MKIGTIKAALQSLIILAVLAGLALPWTPVSAALRSCRTDPILTFSDGSILTVTASINTDEANVSKVIYTVHVPAGLSLVRTVYTAGGLGNKEVVVVVDDQKPGVYQSDTLVTTLEDGVQVKALSSLNPGTFGSASGYNNEHLGVTLFSSTKPGSTSWTSPNYALKGK